MTAYDATTGAVGSLGRRLLHSLDDVWCRALLGVAGDRSGLLSFLFHAVAQSDEEDVGEAVVDPVQSLPVESLEEFVRHFSSHGYKFVTPEEILAGLPPAGRYVFMTFDDGYYNNVRMLPVLRRHGVPATFFITTGHVAEGKAFWWDTVYRERTRRGTSPASILREQNSLKALTHDRIDAHIRQEFGARALNPVGDEDRPMTPGELAEFAREPLVHLGNHTRDHAILTNYEREGMEDQIRQGQEMLEEMSGRSALMIAYPNGNHSPEVIEAARRCGLQMGIVVDPRRNALPLGEPERLRLGRFCFTRGADHTGTFRGYRAGLSLRAALRRLVRV